MKSKPKSIRFDEEKLEFAKKHLKKDSAQKVVDYLLDSVWWKNNQTQVVENNPYAAYVPPKQVDELIVEEVEKSSKTRLPKDKKPKESPKPLISTNLEDPMPVKQEGEDALDFAVRKNEWKKRQKNKNLPQ